MTQIEKDFLIWFRDYFGYDRKLKQHIVHQEVFSRFADFVEYARVEGPDS